MSIKFRNQDGTLTAAGKILNDWWLEISGDEQRAARAILKRAASPTEVALTAPYQRLLRRLQAVVDLPVPDRERLAAAIGLLACVKVDDSRPIPQAMSECAPGERPPVSELRFLRLLDAPDVESLYTGLRRLLPLMMHQANLLALANDVVHWGDHVKKRWAYDYRWPDKPAV